MPEPELKSPSRVRQKLSGWRRLAQIAYRDPEHVSERLTLFGAVALSEPSREWATRKREERPDVAAAVIAEELRGQTANVARIDGAVAGTPFFIAFVPGYLSYLWQEGRMALRTAALYGRDPASLDTSAEVLALRGVHPDVDTARAALLAVQNMPLPDKPESRRSLGTWWRSGYALLVFGGFLSAPDPDAEPAVHPRVKLVLSTVFGGVLWLTTWVFPVTFMVLMAWGCESHARQLGRRALVFYEGEASSVDEAIAAAKAQQDHGHDARSVLRATLLVLSVAVPMGVVALSIHVEHSTGVGPFAVIGALVALSLVIAISVGASRR